MLAFVFSTSTYANETWPQPDCWDNPYWLMFANMKFCFEKSQVEHLNHLYLSSPSLHVMFNADESYIPELGLNRLDTRKTTGGLHSHLGLSVHEMFSQIVSRSNKSSGYSPGFAGD